MIDAAIDYFSGVFKPESFDEQVLMRGREFPRSIGRAGASSNRESSSNGESLDPIDSWQGLHKTGQGYTSSVRFRFRLGALM